MTAARLAAVSLAALLIASPAAFAQPTAAQAAGAFTIVHAKAYVTPGAPPVLDATIVVRDGHIAQVAAGASPPSGATVVDAHGRIVTPGLMNADTQLGVVEVASTDDAVDQSVKTGPLGASFDIEYALNANSELVATARADGLTRAASLPTASAGAPFAGQAAALRLGDGGDVLDRAKIAVVAVVGGSTSASVGGSRAAQWQILRNALGEARAYGARPRGLAPRDQLLNHLDAEALAPVLDGRVPLAIVAQRESDIRQAIALARDEKVKVVVVGGAEAWRVAGPLAAAGIPVIVDPFANLPYSLDEIGARADNAARLQRAGVTIALAPIDGISNIYTSYLAGEALREGAGLAVANGLSWGQALKAITINPAAIWGLSDHYGGLAPGQDADLVIWHGDPLDVSGWPDAVFVQGRAVSLKTHQSALRDRYAPAHAADPWPSNYR